MASSQPAQRRNVVVFGASWAKDGSALYQLSVDLGKALGAAGFNVVSGGYLGTMEGVSKGVRESGGEAIGVLVPTLFPDRATEGNRFLSSQLETPTLLTRIDRMIACAEEPRGVLALPGTLGTLTEIFCAWNMAVLAPLGKYRPFKVICWRDPWEAILLPAAERLSLAAEQRAALVFVSSVEEALAALCS